MNPYDAPAAEEQTEEQTEEQEETPGPYTPLTADELFQLAIGVIGGSVFGSWEFRNDQEEYTNLPMVFVPLLFAGEGLKSWMNSNGIVAAYEYVREAGPRGINGYPCFFSCRFLNREDATRLREQLVRIQAVGRVVRGEGPVV